jgi:hypothetical protein
MDIFIRDFIRDLDTEAPEGEPSLMYENCSEVLRTRMGSLANTDTRGSVRWRNIRNKSRK